MVVTATWTTSIDAVSAAMMHDTVMNEYILDAGTDSGTDWVVTYPTKRFYVNVGTGTPPKLFQRNFGASGACDDVSCRVLGPRRAGASGSAAGILAAAAGHAAFVAVLGSERRHVQQYERARLRPAARNVNIPFQNGWAHVDLVGGATAPIHQLTAVGGQTFNGLPVVGFAVSTFYNGAIPLPAGGTLQSAYAGAYKHKTTSN